MKAVCWFGRHDMRVENVPDPKILNPRDAIVRITSTAICGSDLHLYNGFIPAMEQGDIVGHEFMGEVVEVGSGVDNLKVGDRVVVPFTISCGSCFFCERTDFSLCENSNPNTGMAEEMWGYSPAGLFGYSHMLGGYAGGQAEYARVPFADVGPIKIPDGLKDEQALFLSDVLPTGYMGAENCDIEEGDTVAVWGCGPVGLFCLQSAFLLGAEKVVAIDRIPERLKLARSLGAETINYDEAEVYYALREMTGGRGPDCCIDAVGLEARSHGLGEAYDKAKTMVMLETDRPHALREVILSCRAGGRISVPGVYGGFIDKVPMGAFVNKALTMKSGQTHVQRYMEPLLKLIMEEKLDPTFIISHTLPLDDAPDAYHIFNSKEDECTKVVLKP